MNANYTFPRREQPQPQFENRPPPASSSLRSSPPNAASISSKEATEDNRQSNALRASVLDAALQLGVGDNNVVAKWMFSNTVEEDEEEMQLPSPGLTASGSTAPSTSEESYPHSASSHGNSNHNYVSFASAYTDPLAADRVRFADPPVDTSVSSHGGHHNSNAPATPPSRKKLRKKRVDGGYESDGGYVSDGGARGRKNKDASAKDLEKIRAKEEKLRAKEEKEREKEIEKARAKEERKEAKRVKAGTGKEKDSGYATGYDTDASVSSKKPKRSRTKKKPGAGNGYETDDGYQSSGGLKKSKSFFKLGKKKSKGELTDDEGNAGSASLDSFIPPVPMLPPMTLPIADRFALTPSASRSTTPLPPSLYTVTDSYISNDSESLESSTVGGASISYLDPTVKGVGPSQSVDSLATISPESATRRDVAPSPTPPSIGSANPSRRTSPNQPAVVHVQPSSKPTFKSPSSSISYPLTRPPEQPYVGAPSAFTSPHPHDNGLRTSPLEAVPSSATPILVNNGAERHVPSPLALIPPHMAIPQSPSPSSTEVSSPLPKRSSAPSRAPSPMRGGLPLSPRPSGNPELIARPITPQRGATVPTSGQHTQTLTYMAAVESVAPSALPDPRPSLARYDLPPPSPPPTTPLPRTPPEVDEDHLSAAGSAMSPQRGRVSPFPSRPVQLRSGHSPSRTSSSAGFDEPLHASGHPQAPRYQGLRQPSAQNQHMKRVPSRKRKTGVSTVSTAPGIEVEEPSDDEYSEYDYDGTSTIAGVIDRYSYSDDPHGEYLNEGHALGGNAPQITHTSQKPLNAQDSSPITKEGWTEGDRSSRWSGSYGTRASFMDNERSEDARMRFMDRVNAMYDGSGREVAVPPVPKIPLQHRNPQPAAEPSAPRRDIKRSDNWF